MATPLVRTARLAMNCTRQQRPASLNQHRGLAGAADHDGPPRVNIWQDPLSPSKWKEEHFVIASLSGWGLVFFGIYKWVSGRNKKKEAEKLLQEAQQ